jgi:hypothetical protein
MRGLMVVVWALFSAGLLFSYIAPAFRVWGTF